MAKAQEIIERAYQLLGIKAFGDPLGGDELDYGLKTLNDLIDSWQTDSLFIPYVTEFVQTISGSPVTIGAGQTINTTRPEFIRNTSFFRISNTDYPITWVEEAEFNGIENKSLVSNYPFVGYYDQAYPAGKLYFYPAPSNVELHLIMDAILPAFADYTTDVNIGRGYKQALAYSLAEELAPGLREPTPSLVKNAMRARQAIRNKNVRTAVLEIDDMLIRPNRYGYFYAN